MDVELRAAASDADLAAWAAVRNAVAPDNPVAVETIRPDPGDPALRLLASVDGAVAGCGFAGRSDVRDAAFVYAWVLPDRRRRGVGSALLAALAEHARGMGVSVLRTRAIDDEGGAAAFLTRRGFVEVARECEVRLNLAALAPPGVVPPAGVEIASVGSRLDLARQLHELAEEGMADVPTAEDIGVPPFDEWRRGNVDEALRDGSFVAVAGGRVVGWAGLTAAGNPPGIAEHLLTAVARSWRRRGIARALKAAQIGWALRAGYRELVTFSDAKNVPMRRLNASLGYLPRPDQITFHRPVRAPAR